MAKVRFLRDYPPPVVVLWPGVESSPLFEAVRVDLYLTGNGRSVVAGVPKQ